MIGLVRMRVSRRSWLRRMFRHSGILALERTGVGACDGFYWFFMMRDN